MVQSRLRKEKTKLEGTELDQRIKLKVANGVLLLCLDTKNTDKGKLAVRKTKSGFATKKEALEYIPKLLNNEIKKTITISELYEIIKERDINGLSKK